MGTVRRAGVRHAGRWAVACVGACVLLLLCLGRGTPIAKGDPPVDDGVPQGSVMFFEGVTACPDGFARSDLATGRLVVGVVDGPGVEGQVGTPLGDREDRTHAHAYSANVSLGSRGVLAIDGWNKDGAYPRTYTVAGTTSAKTTGAPFVQVLACEKL